ncbi:unnamed protein product, partial [Meganyctiphanes norvegica]
MTGMWGQQKQRQVSGSSANMPEILGKRVGKLPPYLKADYDMFNCSPTDFQKMPRGGQKGGRRGTAAKKGGGEGSRGGESRPDAYRGVMRGGACGGRRVEYDSDDDDDDDDDTISNDTQNEREDELKYDMNLLGERVHENTDRITYCEESHATCLGVIFRVLFKKLTSDEMADIVKEAGSTSKESHALLQNYVSQEMTRRGTENMEIETNQNESERSIVTRTAPAGDVNLENFIEQTVARKTTERVRETFENIEKKKNIIISGLDENMDDKELINEMFRIIGCRNLVNEIVKRPTRLGIARTGRNRPMKVELRNEWTVDQIVRNKKELMFSHHFYRVYINRDLSKEDRENEKNERQARRNNKFGEAASGAGSGGDGRRYQQ